MRLALMSDIHANRAALDAVAPLLAHADKLLFLGDAVGYNRDVNECVDWLRESGAICVLGNHDHWMLHGCPQDLRDTVRSGIEYAASVITPRNRGWLDELPLTLDLEMDGRTMLAVHGSPWGPLEDYVYPDDPRIGDLFDFAYDVVALGQTHRPIVAERDGRLVVNPGSVGQPRDVRDMASVAFVDFATLEARVERVPLPG